MLYIYIAYTNKDHKRNRQSIQINLKPFINIIDVRTISCFQYYTN